MTESIISVGGNLARSIPEDPVDSLKKGERTVIPRVGRAPALGRAVFSLTPFAGSLAMVAAALVLGLVLQHLLGISNIALVFLTAVLASAVSYGLWPSLFACLASVLAYDFFFVPPIYSFVVDDPENLVTLVAFAVVAVIVSSLTARVHAQALAARERARTTEDLYLFSRNLAGIPDLEELLEAMVRQIGLMLEVRTVLLLPQGDSLVVRAAYPREARLYEADLVAGRWAWQKGVPTGRGTDTLSGARRLYTPLRTGRGLVGVVGLESNDGAKREPLLAPEQRRLFDALTDQAALAIERHRLAQNIEEARVAAATERLRGALLTSISHDLRTPLASILGSATSLKNFRRTLDDAAQDELVATIQEEAELLNRFIVNLLDMTRIEAGAVRPRAEIVDLGDIIGSALERARKALAKHRVSIIRDRNLPMLKLDPVLFEQVLFNLLDNAAKYASGGTEICLSVRRQGGTVQLQIIDRGSGIPPDDLERIFDKFYRVGAADNRRVGTGLGLAICRGFVEAMGGTIAAANRSGGAGAVFTIAFRVPLPETLFEEAAE